VTWKGGDKMKVTRVEQHIIKKNNPLWQLIDNMCFKSKNLYNYGNYIIRQEFINNGNWIHYNSLFDLCKESEPYKDLGSNVGQATLRLLDKNWKSFFKAIKDWKQNPSKYLGRPRLPKYKPKDGRFILSIDNNKVMLKDGFIYFAWKPLKALNNHFITKIAQENKVFQCRFIPTGSNYMMEIVYEIEVAEQPVNSERIISIDLGVDNFVTITNNVGLTPFVIKGGVIKSTNQYYNKEKARIQSQLKTINKKDWSNRLQKLTDKRNNKVKYLMHVYSKRIIDYCLENGIDTIVCGYNKEWKQESVMTKKTNQKFVAIPYEVFVRQLDYKSLDSGKKFILNEESYTSGTSFLDNEEPIKSNYNKSRRVYRGLFKSNTGKLINADVNGSYQIMKKVFPNAFSDGIEGVGCHPMIVKVA
jgi:putative transposase